MDNGAWELPGGILEHDEYITAGVVREVAEETGVTVHPVQLTGVYKNVPLGIVSLVFLCYAVSGAPRPTQEARNVEWCPKGKIKDIMTPAFSCRLLDALGTDMVAVRNHDGVNLL
jgi:ADP-ribose pyrophosphatase YjhB (NUDIX family)